MSIEIVWTLEKITPADAARMRAVRHPTLTQRPISESYCRARVRDMNAGVQVVTHQCPALAPCGFVIDGQHTLRAVELFGHAVVMYIARYMSDDAACEAMRVLDTGRKRTVGDIGGITGVLSDRHKDRVAVAVLALVLDDPGNTRVVPTADERLKSAQRYYHAHGVIDENMPGATAYKMAPFVWAFEREERVAEIAQRVWAGVGLEATEAALNTLIKTTAKGRGGNDMRLEYCLRVLRGLRAVLDGERLAKWPAPTKARAREMFGEKPREESP